MGLTHYWQYNRDFSQSEWETVGRAFSALVDMLPDIQLAGPTATGKPELDADHLAFNGRAGRAVEPFVLYRAPFALLANSRALSERPFRGFCKTEYLPYDVAVRTMLLLVQDIAPAALTVNSDEDLNATGWVVAKDTAVKLKAYL